MSRHSLPQNWTPEQVAQGRGLLVQVRQCQQWDFTWKRCFLHLTSRCVGQKHFHQAKTWKHLTSSLSRRLTYGRSLAISSPTLISLAATANRPRPSSYLHFSCNKLTPRLGDYHLILTASLNVGNFGFSPGREGSTGFGLDALGEPPPSKAVDSSFLNLQSSYQ